MRTHYDLIAIGGGSGGLAVAERAAALGGRVAVIDPAPLGGTCVNAGCVPKKLMWYAAQAATAVRESGGFGLRTRLDGVDWSHLVSARDGVLADINAYWSRYVQALDIHHLAGYARFADPRGVLVNGTRVSAEHIVIATGSQPIVPPVSGAELGITSDGFFGLQTQPRRVAVVGAGYIGVELAGVLRALGSEVTVIAPHDRVLAVFDDIISVTVAESMTRQGIELALGTTVESLAQTEEGIAVRSADGRSLDGFDTVIWAVGRRPDTAGLDLPAAGLATDRGGFLRVDASWATERPGIYAVGDITGEKSLTPLAIAAGRRLAELLLSPEQARPAPHAHVPTVVFAHPPVGAVGLTEAEACARYAKVQVYETQFSPLGQAFSAHPSTTAMKLVCAGSEQRVVGIHMVGEGVDEMLQGFAVALNSGITKAELDRTVAIHPTSAEELVTLKSGRPGGCGPVLEQVA